MNCAGLINAMKKNIDPTHISSMETRDLDTKDSNNSQPLDIFSMDLHKVILPPPKSTLAKFKAKLKETFFPDDPLRQFKGQSLRRKWLLGAQYFFPVLQWGSNYSLELFKSDIISGLTIANSSFVPPLVYVLLGSSRDLAVGPVSIASLVMGSMLRQEVSPTAEPILFLHLAFTCTFFAGLFQASLGILRLGFIIDFLSKATLVGFMAGAAVIVSLQQLKGLLGIVHFTKQMSLVPVLTTVIKRKDEWSWQTILMGVSFLGILLLARHVSLRKPKLFWVSAAAPLVCVILSSLLVFSFKAQNHGISIIGALQHGLNPPSWKTLQFQSTYLALVIKTGLITGILSLTEGIAVGRTFASLKNYKVDGNKEMNAIGIMNIVGSLTSCYITTGSFSRSAVNHNAGSKTAMSNIVMAMTVLITLLFLMPLFHYTPNVILGAIIVTAVIGLIDIPGVYLIWKIDKVDFLVCISAFLGVIFISVQDGLAIAVSLSIFKVLLQITRPKTVILGNLPGTDIYQNLHHYKEATRIPGFLILNIQAPVNFANTTYLTERITRWVEEEEEGGNGLKKTELHFVILDMSGVSGIDTSGISLLIDLKKMTEKRSLELALVNPVGEVMEKLQRANQAENFMGVDSFYMTIGEAVKSLSMKNKGDASNRV